MQKFYSVDELFEYSSSQNCYMLYKSEVFDVTENLKEMEYVSVDDCGKDISAKLNQDEEYLFYGLNADSLVGALISRDDLKEEVEQVPLGQKSFNIEVNPASITLLTSVFLAIVVLGVLLFKNLKGKKKK